MKIINHSNLEPMENLWVDVATHLNLNGSTRDSDVLDSSELEVIIQKQVPRNNEENSAYGEYSLGRIKIMPCRDCGEGTIFITFLHELLHHWLYEFHERLYFEDWTEDFCELTANDIFLASGGVIRPESTCQKWQIEYPTKSFHRKSKVGKLLTDLNKLTTKKLHHDYQAL